MANKSPPLIGSRAEPFIWSDSQQLEINPNHWAADNVVLALPLNRKFIEDVSPYQSLVTISVKGSANLSTVVLPQRDGNTTSMRSAGTGDGIYIDAPHTDALGGSGTGFTMASRQRSPQSARNWRTPFAKGGGSGSNVWFGYYMSASSNEFFQFDDGSSGNVLDLQVLAPGTPGYVNTENWGFAAQSFHYGVERRAYLAGSGAGSASSTSIHIANPHNWVIGNEQFRNNYFQGEVKDIVVLDRHTGIDAQTDLDHNFADLFRPKVKRSFFFYDVQAAPPAADFTPFMVIGAS